MRQIHFFAKKTFESEIDIYGFKDWAVLNFMLSQNKGKHLMTVRIKVLWGNLFHIPHSKSAILKHSISLYSFFSLSL